MTTILLLAIAASLLILATVPVVLFALMLETCERQAPRLVVVRNDDMPPTVRCPLRAAA